MLPENLYTAEQSRELDRLAMEAYQIPGYELMCRAGTAAYRCARQRWPQTLKWSVICGPGNNGGDGFVMARLAKQDGIRVRVHLVGEAAKLSGDALSAYQDMCRAGIDTVSWDNSVPPRSLFIDALFGTGLDRPVRGPGASIIDRVNHDDNPVFSVDIPSGLHADTGVAMGATVRADATMSFIGLKQGLFTGQAREYTGEVFFDDLGVPKQVYSHLRSPARLIQQPCGVVLAPRRRDAHKGSYGHVAVIGGDQGMAGAALLAASAAQGCGAGLVTLLTHPAHADRLAGIIPEVMVRGVERGRDLLALLQRATRLVLGPGLGQSTWSKTIYAATMQSPKAKVLDADALNWLSNQPSPMEAEQRRILTPHPGEAARLLQQDIAAIEKNRFESCRQIARRYGGVCILKGAGTLIQGQGEEHPDVTDIIFAGNPGMATGGMGDVLAGLAGGLWAQCEPGDARDVATLAAFLHAKAADNLALLLGQRGLAPSRLPEAIRKLMHEHFAD